MSDETPASLTALRVAQLADTLATEARTGLHWTKDHYDRERYERFLAIAAELLARTLAVSPDTAARWYTDQPGTQTAKVGASAAAFDAAGRLLLIQRMDNARWALPGGIVEYGESPATAAAREAWEESGVHVRVTALLGIYNTRLHGFNIVSHWIHNSFLADVLDGTPGPSNETLAAGFFTEAETMALPLHPGHADPIRDALAAHATGHVAAFFDP